LKKSKYLHSVLKLLAVNRQFARWVIEELDLGNYQRILEVGCGLGTVSRQVRQHCQRLLCTDADASLVRKMRRNFPHAEFAVLELGKRRRRISR